MKNSYYFPHDYHSRFDPKLCALIKNFGMEGYGAWWMLVEIMHEQGGRIEKFPKLFEGLAHDLKQNEAHLKQIISALINDYSLLKEDDTHIWSIRVLRNMNDLTNKRLQKVAAGRLGGILSGIKRSKTKQNEATLEADEQKESKVKESKVKEIKDITTLSGKPDLEAPILYLNEKTKRNYSLKNKSNQDLVKARFNEGRTIEDFKKVIDKKVKVWLTDDKMMMYLRPETLFNRSKFESYLNEPEVKPEDEFKKKWQKPKE